MAGAIVRTDWISGDGTSGNTIVIPSASHANGNALVFIGIYSAGALTVTSIVGGGAGETGNGSAWASLASQIVPSDRYLIHGISNISAFTGTVTLTLSGAATFRGGILVEISGAALSTPFVAAGSTPLAPGSGTDGLTLSASPSVQPGIAIAFFGDETQHGQIPLAGTGWTSLGTFMPFNGTSGTNGASNDAANDTARLESKTYTATGSQAATATATASGASDIYAAFVVFVKDAAGGGSDTNIAPTKGTVAITGVAPVVTQQINRTPVAGTLAFSGSAPVVQILGTVRPNAGALALSGNAPVVTQGAVRTPVAGTLSLVGVAPVITNSGGNVTITPAAGTLSFTGTTSPQELGVPPPQTGALAFTGVAPVVSLGIVRVPNAGTLAFTGALPTVTNPGGGGPQNTTITPSAGSMSLVAVAPLATQQFYRTPNTGILSFSGSLAALNGNTIITPLAGVLTVSGAAPGVTQQVYIAANAGQLAITGYAPVVHQELGNPVTITPGTGSLTLTGYPWVFPVLEGALPTIFLAAATPVPAAAVFIGGAAFKQTGERYVAAWPADNNVVFLGGFAHRPDGALIIDPSGTIAHKLIGIAMTFRGETVTTVAARELVHSGRSLLQTGKLCVTQQS